MKIDTKTNVDINIDTSQLPNVPIEKIERVIGQIFCRFTRWNCDKLQVISEGNNNLYCQFWDGDEIKITMGAIWREENQEFTFHT